MAPDDAAGVTVVDSKGNAINNSVPVTFHHVSRRVPTGTSITFTPSGSSDNSDIAIPTQDPPSIL